MALLLLHPLNILLRRRAALGSIGYYICGGRIAVRIRQDFASFNVGRTELHFCEDRGLGLDPVDLGTFVSGTNGHFLNQSLAVESSTP